MPDAVNTNALEYKYANPGPGSVAPGSNAVGQSTESSHSGNNPAYATAYEQVHGKGQQGDDASNTGVVTPPGADDRVNPGGLANARDVGPAPTRP